MNNQRTWVFINQKNGNSIRKIPMDTATQTHGDV
jgi:hypothetical protein